MTHAEFEVSLRTQPDGSCAADARFHAPGSAAGADLATNVPVRLDPQALNEASLDVQEYGRRLTQMLFADARLTSAWQQARASSYGADTPLSFRLRLDPSADALHSLRWEALQDPDTGAPLCTNELVRFARYLHSSDLTLVRIPPRPNLKALIVAANPSDLASYHLAPVDVDGEVARARTALGDIPTTVLAYETNGMRATLANISAALRDGPHVCYLVCHGQIVRGESYLWLEQADGTHDRVAGTAFVQALTALTERPLFIVLASCQSAGQSHDEGALAAIGPQLARAGVAAVVAMQGNVAMQTVKQLMPILFVELRRDAQIDRALAAARGVLRDTEEWWVPILFLRVADGRLWREPEPRSRMFSAQLMGIFAVLLLLLVGVGAIVYTQLLQPPSPMPNGWNIAVAGIGYQNEQQTVVGGTREGEIVSDQIFTALQGHADHVAGWRRAQGGVGFIAGSREQRAAQAAEAARRTNADVVIYGVVTPTSPGRAKFQPEFYISAENKDAAVYGAEILGQDQFGAPSEFSLNADEAQAGIRARIDTLKDFLNGLQNYFAQDYVQAHADFEAALRQIGPGDQAGAVISLFLGAVNIETHEYAEAQRWLAQAHQRWPAYARPYLSKGALLYQQAQDQLYRSAPQTQTLELGSSTSCFEPSEIPPLAPIDKLRLAIRCYDAALADADQTSTIDLEPKVVFSQGGVYFILGDKVSPDYWQAARNAFDRVITIYEQSDPTRQTRLFRIAAQAYARRALIVICLPNCDHPTAKTQREYQQAADDYERAIALLQRPDGCKTDPRRCYPGDIETIAAYKRQLDVLYGFLGKKNARFNVEYSDTDRT
jgi:predicted metal-dependent hydrolase